ncbi:type II secretion system GspH family protein [Pseudomonas fuscovaginae UPB0736]|uniref:Type II secretion system protein G (GspG) n=1 Tax=Pseudomonas asplenii TaxID=53407 RepID=A0A1H6MHE1_9PSED|nr:MULTISPECIES: prepilin-type N-terminal cleavage/methylation domain-containing protein [Pseudomonas]UUQ62805.1 type II secretion system GspH family protein [Pseudomonas fuscovaginae UPB0736]SDS56489.1 type II secretion system protein G (GspG) [Pseudomonas asplenii]SEH98485.1 type II secretion system protein G (GspG) [Pseudomonas fuscovaginae]
MAFHTTNGKAGGFTLIELLVVMAIIATLMTLVMPQYFRQHTKAQETVLRHNLVSIRQALDHYREDKGNNPETLEELVNGHYLREIPRDPITGRRDTWQLQRSEDSGFGDVHSGAPGRAVDGSDYGSW